MAASPSKPGDDAPIENVPIATDAEAAQPTLAATARPSKPLSARPTVETAETIAAAPSNGERLNAKVVTAAPAAMSPTATDGVAPAVQPLEPLMHTQAPGTQTLSGGPQVHAAVEAVSEASLPRQTAIAPETPEPPITRESAEPIPMPVLREKAVATTPFISPGSAQPARDIGWITARGKYESGSREQSLALVREGLQVDPEHAGPRKLRADIRRASAAEDNERRVAALLAEAERRLAALRLTLPAGDNAFETYRTVLDIDPANLRARKGITAIADRYGDLARAKRDSGELYEGLRLVMLGLSVDPRHVSLGTLQAELEADLRARAERGQRLEKLFARLQQQMGRQTLSQSAGEAAYETIAAILRLDSGNARAEQLLRKLVARYETVARERRREGALNESLALINAGLAIEPDHAGFVALRKSLVLDIEARRRAELEATQPAEPIVETTRQPKRPTVEAREPAPRVFGTF